MDETASLVPRKAQNLHGMSPVNCKICKYSIIQSCTPLYILRTPGEYSTEKSVRPKQWHTSGIDHLVIHLFLQVPLWPLPLCTVYVHMCREPVRLPLDLEIQSWRKKQLVSLSQVSLLAVVPSDHNFLSLRMAKC